MINTKYKIIKRRESERVKCVRDFVVKDHRLLSIHGLRTDNSVVEIGNYLGPQSTFII